MEIEQHKIIYLILAHKNPTQLARLMESLAEADVYFYVHIDLKSEIQAFAPLSNLENTTFIEDRIDCIWGDFNMVFATLTLIERALKDHSDGMCVLLSESDYPVKSNPFIRSYLYTHYDSALIDIKKAEQVWRNFEERRDYYKINTSSNRGDLWLLKGLSIKTIYCLLRGYITISDFLKIVTVKRKLNLELEFYGGSQWWALNIPTLQKVNKYISDNKTALFGYFKDALIPDEFFFHSIIQHLKQVDNTIQLGSSPMYVNWIKMKSKRPWVFRESDEEELMNLPPDKLFARKFDPNVDEVILDKIDAQIRLSTSI